jgi:acyl carrier protein
LDAVKDIVAETLGLGERRAGLTAATPLFGAMPELDSLAVVQLAMAIETRFGITIDDEDFGSELFATVGSLAGYVEHRRLSDHSHATAAE